MHLRCKVSELIGNSLFTLNTVAYHSGSLMDKAIFGHRHMLLAAQFAIFGQWHRPLQVQRRLLFIENTCLFVFY